MNTSTILFYNILAVVSSVHAAKNVIHAKTIDIKINF